MKIHYLQHVPFENLGNIQKWAENRNYSITKTLLYKDPKYPPLSDFDWLIIMGGSMNVNEEKRYSWLVEEKIFIRKAIDAGKIVLGICFGAQLIADILGGKVYKGIHKEIGWFEVNLTDEGINSPIFEGIPEKFTAFHWHGDTFNLPQQTLRTVQNQLYANQAFNYRDHVICLQFHLEMNKECIKLLIENCGNELIDEKYIQTSKSELLYIKYIHETYSLLQKLLNNIENILT
jgi:GMP synthase-like glutamine amidotransferase